MQSQAPLVVCKDSILLGDNRHPYLSQEVSDRQCVEINRFMYK